MDVGGGLKIGTRRQADFGTPAVRRPGRRQLHHRGLLARGLPVRDHLRSPRPQAPVQRRRRHPAGRRAALPRRYGHRGPGGSVPRIARAPGAVLPRDRQRFRGVRGPAQLRRVQARLLHVAPLPHQERSSGDLHRGGADRRRDRQAVPRPGARQRPVRQPDAGRCAGTHPGGRSPGRRELAPGDRPRHLDRRGDTRLRRRAETGAPGRRRRPRGHQPRRGPRSRGRESSAGGIRRRRRLPPSASAPRTSTSPTHATSRPSTSPPTRATTSSSPTPTWRRCAWRRRNTTIRVGSPPSSAGSGRGRPAPVAIATSCSWTTKGRSSAAATGSFPATRCRPTPMRPNAFTPATCRRGCASTWPRPAAR